MVMGQITNENLTGLFNAVDEYVDLRFDVWRQWRRHLHARPELSWQESETTAFLQERLSEFGLTLNAGPRSRGGYVDLGSIDSGKRIAVRGDIDAIPVREETGLEFCSQVDGVMHACGHDVHATVVLALCDILQNVVIGKVDAPSLNVRAIFQPAEEVAEGATEMMAAGVLDGVERIIAMHVDSSREVGTVGLRDGVQTACCDEISVKFSGPGGHGARPHEAADPVFAASQYINAAYATVPRAMDPRRTTVLSFCQIAGGKSANVIPTDVSIKGTLRSFDVPSRDQVFQKLDQLASTIGTATGIKIEFTPGVSIPSVNNCPDTNLLFRAAAESFLPKDAIDDLEPSLGGEDFACYQARIPGSLVRVGSARGSHGTAWLHSPHFDVDEQVIHVASKLFARAVLQWAQQAS